MVGTARAKLVTIIASSEILDRLSNDLKALGAGGYTSMSVNGHGLHGRRERGAFDSGNVRIETIVSPAVGDRILEHVAKVYAEFELVAFAHEVDAVPRERFA